MVNGNMSQWDERVLRAVRNAAQRSHSAQRGYVEVDDLQQEGYLWIVEHQDKVDGWLEQGRDGLNILHTALYHAMHKFTMRQRYLHDGTKPGDYYSYQTGVLQELLPDALDDEPSFGSSVSDLTGIRSGKPVSEVGDRMAMIADVRSALRALSADEFLIVVEKYGTGNPVSDDALAALLGVSPATANRKVRNVVRKLARQLGSEPVTRRKAMSNAQAQYVTREQA